MELLHAAQVGLLTLSSVVTLVAGVAETATDEAVVAMAPQDSARAMGQGRDWDWDREQARIDEARRLTRDWPEKQRRQIQRMSELHGSPAGVTDHVVIWRDVEPFALITIERKSVRHHFPIKHEDFMAHAVHYDIEPDRVDELTAFDGSVYVDRTGGLLAAKCDTQAHNLLALNLGHDVLSGSRSAKEAQKEFARIIAMEKRGMSHDYLEELQFDPGSPDSAPDPGESMDLDQFDLDDEEDREQRDRRSDRDSDRDRDR